MTPPRAPVTGNNAKVAPVPPAVLSCPAELLRTLTKRPDFLRAARARRQVTRGFVLQARKRALDETDTGTIRIGYTCSKKVGNAVTRNRAKRRLREIARAELPTHGLPGWDYVLIGRRDMTTSRLYLDMVADLRYALRKIHGPLNGPAK